LESVQEEYNWAGLWKDFSVESKCCGSGPALFLASWFRIHIGNADQDFGGQKDPKIKEKSEKMYGIVGSVALDALF
jgi:hypothetical protein